MKMFIRNNKLNLYLGLMAIIYTILLVMLLPPLSEAAPPPRQPTPGRDIERDDDSDEPVGAHIELQAQNASAGVWTVIQWQDNNDHWHDVEGWRGTLDEDNKKRWWVAEINFNKGPFRWLIYQGQDGPLLAATEPFYLPGQPNELMEVEISLGK